MANGLTRKTVAELVSGSSVELRCEWRTGC
jgi:hypothetical protein